MDMDVSASADASGPTHSASTPDTGEARALPATTPSPETSLTPVGKGPLPTESGVIAPQSLMGTSQILSPGGNDPEDQMRLGRSSSEYSDGDMGWAAARAPMSIGKSTPQAKRPCLPKGLRSRAGTPHKPMTTAAEIQSAPDPVQDNSEANLPLPSSNRQDLKPEKRMPLGQIASKVPTGGDEGIAAGFGGRTNMGLMATGKTGFVAHTRGSMALDHARSQPWQTPARTESDITVATQEAFDAINSMFVSPGGMGPAGTSKARGAGGLAGARVGPQVTAERAPSGIMSALRPRTIQRDVTMTTRDAFDTINAMFNGVLPEDAPWHAGANPGAAQAAVEPTITFATQEAFNAINGMMGAQAEQGWGPHTIPDDPCTTTPPRGPSSPNPPQPVARRRVFEPLPVHSLEPLAAQYANTSTRMSPPQPQPKVRRLSHDQRKHVGSQGPAFNLDEDSGLLSSPFPGPAVSSHDSPAAGLAMYEDTALLSPMEGRDGAPLSDPTEYMTENRWAVRLGNQSGRAPLGERQITGKGRLTGEQEYLPVYEDTTLISNPSHAGMMGMSERTEFMPENVGAVRLATRGIDQGGPVAPFGQQASLEDFGQGGEGLAVYEDTGLLDGGGLGMGVIGGINRNGVADNPVMVYEDTQFVTGPCGHGTDGGAAVAKPAVEIYEDTQFLTSEPTEVGPDCPVMASGLQPSSPVVMYEETEFMSENVAPANTYGGKHILTTPQAHIGDQGFGARGDKGQSKGEDDSPLSSPDAVRQTLTCFCSEVQDLE
jgi:hypothetical protein